MKIFSTILTAIGLVDIPVLGDKFKCKSCEKAERHTEWTINQYHQYGHLSFYCHTCNAKFTKVKPKIKQVSLHQDSYAESAAGDNNETQRSLSSIFIISFYCVICTWLMWKFLFKNGHIISFLFALFALLAILAWRWGLFIHQCNEQLHAGEKISSWNWKLIKLNIIKSIIQNDELSKPIYLAHVKSEHDAYRFPDSIPLVFIWNEHRNHKIYLVSINKHIVEKMLEKRMAKDHSGFIRMRNEISVDLSKNIGNMIDAMCKKTGNPPSKVFAS